MNATPMRDDEVRVFAERLLGPAPAGITTDVEHGREALMGADRPHLDADRVGQRFGEIGSHVLARPIACGKTVASRAISPEQISSWTIAGIPRRVSSTR